MQDEEPCWTCDGRRWVAPVDDDDSKPMEPCPDCNSDGAAPETVYPAEPIKLNRAERRAAASAARRR